MDETQVPPEYDIDETYVEGYTQEEGEHTNSIIHVLLFFSLYVDDCQDPLSVSGSRPTTPIITTSSGTSTSVAISVTSTAPSSSSDTTTVSSGNSTRRKGDKHILFKNYHLCCTINK